MAYPGAATSAPNGPNVDFSFLLPLRVNLKRKDTGVVVPAVLKRLDPSTDTETVAALHALLNYEIKQGLSYPFQQEFSVDEAKGYYMSYDCFVLLHDRSSGEEEEAEPPHTLDGYNFGRSLIASVHIRPNFPGRSSHVANGAFLTVPHYRGCGAATVAGSFFPLLAKILGYRVSLFNLVYEANAASVALWRKLRYPEVGRVENAGALLLRRRDGEAPEEVSSAAIMFSVQLDDARVVSVASVEAATVAKARVFSLAEIEAAIGSPFGSFLLRGE
jgi:hypothetical protein